MQYFRIGPTPCLRTSHPASVSMGDPPFPIWTSSQGKAGLRSNVAFVPEVDVVGEGTRTIRPRRASRFARPHTEGLFLLLESLGHSAAAWRIVSRRWVVSARFPHVRCRAGGSPGSKDSEPRLLGWFSSELGGTAVSMGRLPDFISESISRSCQRRLKIPRPPAASGGDTGTLLFPPELIF